MNSNYKIFRKFNLNDEWSENNIVEHHYIAIISAYKQNNKIFNFNNNNIKYDLILISLEPIIFVQIKEDNSISYFNLLQKRYIKKLANDDIIVDYLKHPIIISKNKYYYFDNQLNKIVIGWHGSYSPPYGMDGLPIIDDNEWF